MQVILCSRCKNKFYFGRPGLFGNRIANFAIQSCDLLIILGSRLSVPITGYQMKNFSPLSKKNLYRYR